MKNINSNENHKGLSAWHLTMIALGTVIGGSFFLGSAVAIEAAGPSILISFILGGVLVYFILFAISEMTVSNPTPGSFRTYASEAYGPGTGFVVGWVYWTGMVLAMSSEATAVSILVRQWFPNISLPLLGSTIIISVTLLNLLGADKLSKLESGLSFIKLLAIAAFIIIALTIIVGLLPNTSAIGSGELANEPFAPGGIGGIAGSMLLVIFSYAGFEIIGLAASEADNPQVTVPKAINYTVFILVGFYVLAIGVLLPLIPTSLLNEDTSPMVAALSRWGMNWASTAINFVLMTAILSTMLAAMFGLGRMMRSLADAGQAPAWLKDKKDVPYRGILFSGASMLFGLWFGLLLPRVYLFLVSSGGFSVLFTYIIIVATHIRFRKKHGCPEGKCKVRGYPYSSLFVLISLIVALLSMPLISGQVYGFFAGIVMVTLYSLAYFFVKHAKHKKVNHVQGYKGLRNYQTRYSTEFSKEHTFEKKHSTPKMKKNTKKPENYGESVSEERDIE